MKLVLLGGAALGAWLLFGDKLFGKDKPSAPGVPEFDPEAIEAITVQCELRASGGRARVFKLQVADAILQDLQASGLNIGPRLETHPDVAVYQVVPYAEQPQAQLQLPNARVGVQTALTQDLAVLGTYSLVSGRAGVRKLLAFVRKNEVGPIAGVVGSQWAVLGAPSDLCSDDIPPGGDKPLPAAHDLDKTLSPEMRQKAEEILADRGMDPFAVEDAAKVYQDGGYTKTAALLRKHAKDLREEKRLRDTTRGGSPYVIRSGDTASYLAKFFTGDGGWSRIKELIGANSSLAMKSYKDKKGYTQLDPWEAGLEVLLPVAWKAWNKRLPPTQGGGKRPGEVIADELVKARAPEPRFKFSKSAMAKFKEGMG